MLGAAYGTIYEGALVVLRENRRRARCTDDSSVFYILETIVPLPKPGYSALKHTPDRVPYTVLCVFRVDPEISLSFIVPIDCINMLL
jgi:hypothetical protein